MMMNSYTMTEAELKLATALKGLKGRDLNGLQGAERDVLVEAMFPVIEQYIRCGKQRRLLEAMQIPLEAAADEAVMRLMDPNMLGILVRDGLKYMHKVVACAAIDALRKERRYSEQTVFENEEEWANEKAEDPDVEETVKAGVSARNIFSRAWSVLTKKELFAFFGTVLLGYKAKVLEDLILKEEYPAALRHVIEETGHRLELRLPLEEITPRAVTLTAAQISKYAYRSRQKLRKALAEEYPEYVR